MATQVSGYIGRIDPGNGTNYALGSTAYGYCETAAATAAKVVDMTGFTLVTGATIHVKMKYSNTVANPTLNVNSTGAKSIKRYGTTAPSTSAITSWNAEAVVSFTYDGTYWMMNDNMLAAARTGFINATDLADYLVRQGLPFRTAYKLSGELVADCIAGGKVLETLPLEKYRARCDLIGEDVYAAIDLDRCVEKRTSAGGTSFRYPFVTA